MWVASTWWVFGLTGSPPCTFSISMAVLWVYSEYIWWWWWWWWRWLREDVIRDWLRPTGERIARSLAAAAGCAWIQKADRESEACHRASSSNAANRRGYSATPGARIPAASQHERPPARPVNQHRNHDNSQLFKKNWTR